MTYVEAQIAHGQREGLFRHHGGGAGTARTQAHRLLQREALSSTWPGPCAGGEGCRDSGGELHPPHGEPFPASAAPPWEA
eukprot:3939421-Pleurochrysis_carterae.AAC.2